MSDDTFEMPDMSDLLGQMQKAMSDADDAMEDLPDQMGDLQGVMGSLSSLVEGMPGQLGDLGAAMESFDEQHAENAASLNGEPNWIVEADVRVDTILHVLVSAAFDLETVVQAWQSTQGGGFESLVAGVVADTGEETDSETMGQIMEQLQKGRSIAQVTDVKVLECSFQGAPGDAAEQLQLSPEGNIPLVMDESGLGFELAPVLTVQNRWENADVPTFTPMGEQLRVSLTEFEAGEPFAASFNPSSQDRAVIVELRFSPTE